MNSPKGVSISCPTYGTLRDSLDWGKINPCKTSVSHLISNWCKPNQLPTSIKCSVDVNYITRCMVSSSYTHYITHPSLLLVRASHTLWGLLYIKWSTNVLLLLKRRGAQDHTYYKANYGAILCDHQKWSTIINKHIILVTHDNGDANTGYYCLC